MASQRYAYQFLSFPINYRILFLFLFFFSFSWNWYSNGRAANRKKILCLLFRHEEVEITSVFQQNATFLQTWAYFIHFATIKKKSALRYSSYKSTVLTIFQFKEVPFLRFKLLAFLSLSAQAFFPLRQQGTQKKQDILAANREAQWKFCSHGVFAQRETEPNQK